MDIPRFYKVAALPTSPTAANDGVYFVRPSSGVGYICYIITNGVVVQQDAVTTAVLIAAVANGNTAFGWGNFRDFGLGTTGLNIPVINPYSYGTPQTTGFYRLGVNPGGLFTDVGNNALYMHVDGNGGRFGRLFFGTVAGNQPSLHYQRGSSVSESDVIKIWDNNNFNPAQYVMISALNSTLAGYATLAGTQTFTGQITYTQAPIVPNGTLNGHTVNLGQLNTLLANYALLSAIPTNNNQLTNGAGYITATALGGYVLQTSLNSQLANYITVNGVQNITATKTFTVSPVVPNGTLAGHAVNKSQLDNAVANGNTAYNQLVSLFSNLEKYKKVHTPTPGANIKTDEVFFTVVNTSSLSGGTINVLDHTVDGARLVIQTINLLIFSGRFMTAALAPLNSIPLENKNKEYMWDADINRWREIF